MQLNAASRDEWKRGWRIVLGAMFCSAMGMPLYYATASLFTLGMLEELNVSRGVFANVQALLVVGALVAPLMGRTIDRFGVKPVYLVGMVLLIGAHLAMATVVSSIWAFAMVAFIYGSAGLASGPLVYTRPINHWFWHSRGLALGVAALGVALMALLAPSGLAALIEAEGWRSGYWALVGLGAFVGIPMTLMLFRDSPPEGPAGPIVEKTLKKGDRSHIKERDFWLLGLSHIAMAIPGAGLLSQLSPLIQDEGIGPMVAAFAVSAYAVGQVTGRIVAGWFLDRVDPRRVALFFTIIPALGLIMLAAVDLPPVLAIMAAALVGIQQGAEIDLFAYFTARRFGLERYGTVYGWMIAFGWIGNAIGILAFGWLFVAFGSYALPEAIGAGLLVIGAILIALVRIDRVGSLSEPSHSSPVPLQAP